MPRRRRHATRRAALGVAACRCRIVGRTSIGCVQAEVVDRRDRVVAGIDGDGRRRGEPAALPRAGSARSWSRDPSSDQTASSPPCSRASPSAIDSPRPVPPIVRVRDGSARQKRSKTRSTSSGVMPRPKSRTPSATACWSLSTVIDDRPPLAVLDRVAEEVAHDAAHAARVHLDRRVPAGSDQAHVGAVLVGELVHRADDVLGEMRETRRLELELHRSRVVAADLEQVGQQRLEPLHLRVQQLGGPRRRRDRTRRAGR